MWAREGTDREDAVVRERFARVVGLPVVDDTDEGPPAVPDRAAVDAAVRRAAGGRRLAGFDPGRRGVRALAAVAVLVVGVAAFLAWRARPQPVAVPARVATSSTMSAGSASASAGTMVVAVAGRVHRPGLVRLPTGSRVADAIEAAGGVLPGTDLSFINLARKLVDGELILVGVTPPPGAGTGAGAGAGGAPGAPAGPVNLNTATLTELQTLPGVGAVLGQRIVDYRAAHGGFKSVAELRNVSGIGDTRYQQLKDLVTV
jgi:competence protein ComEA